MVHYSDNKAYQIHVMLDLLSLPAPTTCVHSREFPTSGGHFGGKLAAVCGIDYFLTFCCFYAGNCLSSFKLMWY